MKFSPRLIGLAIFASVTLLGTLPLTADDIPATPPTSPDLPPAPPGPTVTVSSGVGQPTTVSSSSGLSDEIDLQPNQTVTVTVQYGMDKVGHIIVAEPLDGGSVVAPGPQMLVAADGTLTFQFQDGAEPGWRQVSLHDGTEELGLEFWVLAQ